MTKDSDRGTVVPIRPLASVAGAELRAVPYGLLHAGGVAPYVLGQHARRA